MNTNFLVIRFLVILTITTNLLISCDDDISNVGANALIGSELNIVIDDQYSVTTNQIEIKSPRVNNLDYYLLGNNDHGFGNTQYGILGQIFSASIAIQDLSNKTYSDEDDTILATSNDVKHELVKIELVLPFRYSQTDNTEDSANDISTYNIDSRRIGETLTLNVYKSNYILQITDPNNIQGNVTESYFIDNSESDQITDGSNSFNIADITGNNSETLASFAYSIAEAGETFEVESFFNEDDDVDENDSEHTAEGLSNQFDAIRIPIPIEKFTELTDLITDEDGDFDTDSFNEISILESFPGIYIEATNQSENSVVEILDFNQTFVNAGLQLTFNRTTTFNSVTQDDDNLDSTPITEDELIDIETVITTLQFTNNPINIIRQTSNNEEEVDSEKELILQSGLGGIGAITLFNDQELTELYDKNVLLNDAVLEVTVNTDSSFYLGTDDLPDNIFIYNLESGNIIVDYDANNGNDDDNEELKEGHLIPIRTDDENGNSAITTNENGNIVYRINITRHISNILSLDSIDEVIESNTRLAISTTNEISTTNSALLLTNETPFNNINQGSLLSFNSVPLFSSEYGDSNNKEDINKRPRIILKFTETK